MSILKHALLGSARLALFGSLKAALFVYAFFLSDTPFADPVTEDKSDVGNTASYDAAPCSGNVNIG